MPSGDRELGYRRGAHQAIALFRQEMADLYPEEDRALECAEIVEEFLKKARHDQDTEYPLLMTTALEYARGEMVPREPDLTVVEKNECAIVVQYGDELERCPTIADAQAHICEMGEMPDGVWGEDENGKKTREFYVAQKLVELK